MTFSCEICMELLKSSEDVRATFCGHLFHYSCMSKWFSNGKDTCPHCRRLNSSTGLRKIFLTSIGEDQESLKKNDDEIQIKADLNKVRASLDTLKNDLSKRTNDNKQLQLKIASIEKLHTEQMAKIVGENRELRSKLLLAENLSKNLKTQVSFAKKLYLDDIKETELKHKEDLTSKQLVIDEFYKKEMQAKSSIKDLQSKILKLEKYYIEKMNEIELENKELKLKTGQVYNKEENKIEDLKLKLLSMENFYTNELLKIEEANKNLELSKILETGEYLARKEVIETSIEQIKYQSKHNFMPIEAFYKFLEFQMGWLRKP